MRLTDLAGKKIALLGTGRESQAIVPLLLELGPKPEALIVLDDQAGESFENWKSSPLNNLVPAVLSSELELGSQEIQIVVKSPGISKNNPTVQKLKKHGATITGSTQLWLNDNADKTIAITGSKGKSTTSSLLNLLYNELVAPAQYGGNIGIPIFSLPKAEKYIVELGSYQSSEVQRSPDTVLITSLFPEHLDWHGSEAEYYRDKLNLVGHSPRRVLVNARDERLVQALAKFQSELSYEAIGVKEKTGVYLAENGNEEFFFYQQQPLFSRAALKLVGEHNAWNACLALSVIAEYVDLEAEKSRVESVLSTFEPLAHRLEVIEDSGIRFIDDGLATTPFATIAALSGFAKEEIVLLLGGQDRGVDYAPLKEYLAENPISGLVGLPGSGAKLIAELAELAIPSAVAGNMTEAVQKARELASPGTVVLMSPAAPSFGFFKDYLDRSEQFAAAIKATSATRNQF